ncbi:LEA type 2 family protein [Niveibacterium sp. 24ML]|uniref:LEA type 2 family protein n=1 Tax=Niveibacterium sp. 24ML TaxID=2985512 RepID=UPI0022721B85|nr:LEA type 2 family protein [Niveibacterium sp. 24ML]MCX9156971.1 LEA type 2 family protein [Niveibacterium sp. 24ML]
MSKKWLAPILAAPVLLGGCAMMALGLERPDVAVSDVSVLQGGTLLEQRLRLTLRVSNPNDKDIAIDGLSFRFEVNDQEVARGLSNQRSVLPRLGETSVPVDVSASMVDLLRHAPKMLERGSGGKLAYRVRGDVVTQDYGRLPFDRRGEFSLESLAGKAPREGATRGQF